MKTILGLTKGYSLAVIENYIDSALGVIILSDSENGNKLNLESLKSINAILNSFIENQGVRVILIKSNGENFCLGMDFDELISSSDTESLKYGIDLYVEVLYSIFSCAKPVVSLINGDVKAGGIGLIASSDIIIASEKSTFELSEALFGLIPANVLPFIFSLRITPQKAKYLIFTANKISAIEAKNINLIDEVFKENILEKNIKKVLKSLYRVSPFAVKQTKTFALELLGMDFKNAMEAAKQKLTFLIEEGPAKKAIESFRSGDMPEWFSKFKPEYNLV